MLYSIFDPEIKNAFISNDSTSITPKVGFVLSYKTTTTPERAAHMPVAEIPHPGRPNEVVQWEEVYELHPGAVSACFGVLAQINQSLVAHSVLLVAKRRISPDNRSSVTINSPKSGVLEGVLGDTQNLIDIFADGVLGDKLTASLLRAFSNLNHPTVRVLDAGIYLLFAPDIDETFYPHHASFNTKTVATFTQFGLDLNFRMAETVLADYKLTVDTTEETRYLDQNGNPVGPNFFSWL